VNDGRSQREQDEFRREKLLKQRWRRWEEMILVLGFALSMVASGLSHESIVSLVTHWFT
jgi:hypothetical protein